MWVSSISSIWKGTCQKEQTIKKETFWKLLKIEAIFLHVTKRLSKIFSLFTAITACYNNEHLFYIRYVKNIF